MTITYLHDVAHQHRLELKDLLSLYLEDVNRNEILNNTFVMKLAMVDSLKSLSDKAFRWSICQVSFGKIL